MNQHGFVAGRSTVTALNEVLHRAQSSDENYVLVVTLDIAGAFDNAWWPMILTKFKQGGCPPNIYKMLMSYFLQRRVGLFVGNRVMWKCSTMGCPQGSVLGRLERVAGRSFETAVAGGEEGGVGMTAYADDVTITIEGRSRADIEKKAETTLAAVADWGLRNRLGFSAAKSSAMTVKGKFIRAPTIRMDGFPVPSVRVMKLLGVLVDERVSFAQHARHIGEMGAKSFGRKSRASTSSWGVRYGALRLLYSGTYIATITYAAAVWYKRVGAMWCVAPCSELSALR